MFHTATMPGAFGIPMPHNGAHALHGMPGRDRRLGQWLCWERESAGDAIGGD